MVIENRSATPIMVSVDSFTIIDDAGVTLLSYGNISGGKNNLALRLKSTTNNAQGVVQDSTIDLAFDGSTGKFTGGPLSRIDENSSNTIYLLGKVGTASGGTVAQSGAKPEYKIVLKITKTT
jgi:hypothetical protein